MNSLDFWRLCDELTVVQAALLIVGTDPSSEEAALCDGKPANEQPQGFMAATAAITHAVRSGSLKASIRHAAREIGEADWEMAADIFEISEPSVTNLGPNLESTLERDEKLSDDQSFAYRSTPDWNLTTVRVDALRDWLAGRGIKTGFFFAERSDAPEYLDPQHPRYAPKLAASVQAWVAVDDPKGKHPKQALLKWLRENSATFGLSDVEGRPNEQGIEECAKVANWQPGGGAPKTPGA